MTREELAKAIREDYERKGVWACESTTINMRLDFEMLSIILEALEEEPKTGHWIKIKPYPLQMHDYECSKCGHETDDNTERYCSDCGARMIEPHESEQE